MTLWLVGMMGSGKTTAGRLAASRLGVSFIDIDDEVSSSSGETVARIWEGVGEEGFRDLERAAIARVAGEEAIVSTGGGAVLHPENRRNMRESGTVIWLRASAEELASRIEREVGRPLLEGGDRATVMTCLLEERANAYRSAADDEIDTAGLDAEEVAARIEEFWRP